MTQVYLLDQRWQTTRIDDVFRWQHTMGWHRWVQGRCNRLLRTFTIGSKFSQAFTYLGIEIDQNYNKSIAIHQNNYARAIQPILLTTNQLTEKDLKIPQEGISAVRSLVGQLNWLSGISRFDISFDTCNIQQHENTKSATWKFKM